MNNTIQDETVNLVLDGTPNKAAAGQSTTSRMTDTASTTRQIRKFQPLRFAWGLLSTTAGVALILSVALRVFELQDVSGDFVMPLNGMCVLIGVMLLGGGFGIMATSSSGFDEDEFDRLAEAGNISAASPTKRRDSDFEDERESQPSAAQA